MQTIVINSLDELGSAAKSFISLVKGYRFFAFYGPMGSGKTTLIKALCKELGAVDLVTSPTFALVNEYRTKSGEMLYHLDLYRINSVEELFDLGYEEYFYSNSIIFIEWPEKAEVLLPESTIRVTLEETSANSRLVRIDL
jgi:tRNA threonylcarbamoyladenosine biosynthesis protein TsaE